MRILFLLLLLPATVYCQKTKPLKLSTPSGHQELISGVVPEPEDDKIICGGTGEVMPEPPYDVNKYLAENMVYPQLAKDSNIDGRVITGFIVTETGAIDSVHIYSGKHPLLDTEALRVVKTMPPWKPGKLQGKTVRVHYKMPVTFRLE